MSDSKPVSIGFVGCGAISRLHMEGIAATPEVRVAACADIDEARAQKWAAQYGVERTFTDWKAMVEAVRPEIVLFATWPAQHEEQVVAAAQLGAPAILCEKSLALSAAEVRRMAAACEKSGTLLMEAFMYRHTPRTRDFLQRARSGEFGEIRYARAAFNSGHYDANSTNWRMDKKAGGGIVFDYTCYCVNILRGIMGRAPVRVSALQEICPVRDIAITMNALFDYGGGVMATVESSMRHCFLMDAEAIGEKGALALPLFLLNVPKHPALPMRQRGGSLPRGNYVEAEIPTEFHNPYALQIRNLARAVRHGEPLGMPLNETLDNLRTIDAMVKSAGTGTLVEVAP